MRRPGPLPFLAASLLAAVVASAATRPLTFFVASDAHFGADGMPQANRSLVEQMNALPGREWPPEVGGRVDTPRGVLFLGDTTDDGLLEEFAQFEEVYGLTGKEGLLKFPIYEAIGNHDVTATSPIKPRVEARHGDIHYSFDWEGIHFVCLDMYPDARTLEWMGRDLAKLRPKAPLVLFFHYSLAGPYSDFWEASDKDAFAKAIANRNVVAIFHGHEHRVGHYVWRGHPVFRPGAPRHRSHFFLAVRVDARTMSVVAWDFDARQWAESWTVPVRR